MNTLQLIVVARAPQDAAHDLATACLGQCRRLRTAGARTSWARPFRNHGRGLNSGVNREPAIYFDNKQNRPFRKLNLAGYC